MSYKKDGSNLYDFGQNSQKYLANIILVSNKARTTRYIERELVQIDTKKNKCYT